MILANCDIQLGVLLAVGPDGLFGFCLAEDVSDLGIVQRLAWRDGEPILSCRWVISLFGTAIKYPVYAPWSVMVMLAFHVEAMVPVYMKRRIPAA